MTPFARVALFAANGLVFGVLAGVGYWLSWEVALVAGLGSIIGTLAVTLERAPDRPRPRKKRERDRILRRPRREIERDAERSREPDEDDFGDE